MDQDEELLRPPWEDDAPMFRRASDRRGANAAALLVPLARAQDAVARLETLVAAAPDDLASGLRARLALFEAAGFLAHRGPPVHPHDLALREAGMTGSYSLAALTGRLKQEAPWTAAAGGEGVPDDHLVAQALALARHWRRLAELSTVQPLRSVATLATSLSPLGAHLADDETARDWLAALPGPTERPGLLAAAQIVAEGIPGTPRGEALDLAPAYVAAAVWRRHGYGRGCALPFWSASISRIDALARQSGTEFQRSYLDCIAEAAQRGARELARLHAAAVKIAALPGRARSRLQGAGAVAVREPLITTSQLARKLGVSPRAGLDLAARLVDAGVLREMTGRAAWRAFAV